MSSENTEEKQSAQTKGLLRGKPKADPEAATKRVIIDYDGSVGRATQAMGAVSNQRRVNHRHSPLVMFWPENGTPDLVLQPGINLVSAAVWELYTKTVNDGAGHPQLKEKIDAGYITVLSEYPRKPQAIEAMVDRSIDIAGLDWMFEQENARNDPRQEILDAITERIAKAHPVVVPAMTFQAKVPNVKIEKAPSTSLAMG